MLQYSGTCLERTLQNAPETIHRKSIWFYLPGRWIIKDWKLSIEFAKWGVRSKRDLISHAYDKGNSESGV